MVLHVSTDTSKHNSTKQQRNNENKIIRRIREAKALTTTKQGISMREEKHTRFLLARNTLFALEESDTKGLQLTHFHDVTRLGLLFLHVGKLLVLVDDGLGEGILLVILAIGGWQERILTNNQEQGSENNKQKVEQQQTQEAKNIKNKQAGWRHTQRSQDDVSVDCDHQT
jgi:hypothetical protein